MVDCFERLYLFVLLLLLTLVAVPFYLALAEFLLLVLMQQIIVVALSLLEMVVDHLLRFEVEVFLVLSCVVLPPVMRVVAVLSFLPVLVSLLRRCSVAALL